MLGMTSKYATSQKRMLHNLLCTTYDMITKNLQKIKKISSVSKQRVKEEDLGADIIAAEVLTINVCGALNHISAA